VLIIEGAEFGSVWSDGVIMQVAAPELHGRHIILPSGRVFAPYPGLQVGGAVEMRFP
jgi:hypothetical protein